MPGAFITKAYTNIFREFGYDQKEIDHKIEQTFHTFFYGTEKERIYHPVGVDMGYLEDTGNHDVRTEGMSYGMMICVQLNKKEEFDRIWKWTKTYMYLDKGENKGYFAWSCQTDGTKNAYGPAPDGEEYFAMALFFASHRWGDKEGIFCYLEQAKAILRECIHKGENGGVGKPMWEPANHLIKFITECDFTDPSYHLPHFYELFALWADEGDRIFWDKATLASRAYLEKACHSVTGLSAEYADYDGTPHSGHQEQFGRHDWYYSDAYRTIANIALDYEWFAKDAWVCDTAEKLQRFFCETVKDTPHAIYAIDGTIVGGTALHPTAMIAVNAQASLAAKGEHREECVRTFWNTSLRSGDRRYYDNCLYFFALLALSGNYRIW